MEREKIERAARRSAALCIEGCKAFDEHVFAFTEGAEWRINSVWHDIDKELPDCGRHVVNEDWFDFEANSVLDLKRILKKYPFKRWAYVSDLIPDRKEDEK